MWICYSDSCTFGDFKGLLYTGQTCAEMVHDSPWLCYRQPESDKCCSSCERIADENYEGKAQSNIANIVSVSIL